jgi:hypothetical protein
MMPYDLVQTQRAPCSRVGISDALPRHLNKLQVSKVPLVSIRVERHQAISLG